MTETTRFLLALITVTTGLLLGVHYETEAIKVNGRPEAVYALTVDMADQKTKIVNGLSVGQLYGFEALSDMAIRENAQYGINGMFYNALGMPYGTIISEGKAIRIQDIGTPIVLIGQNNEVALWEGHFKITVGSKEKTLSSVRVNDQVPDNTWTLFEPIYGKTTRVYRYSTNYKISDGLVTEVVRGEVPTPLKGSDYTLTYAGDDHSFSVGDRINVSLSSEFKGFKVEEAFQTGGWLVRDGLNVAKDHEPFMGKTTAPQPRTLVGITSERNLVFLVIDGRQKDYSIGLTGRESAELLLYYGCVEGAYLDGGASSTMWVDGKVVNRPSGGEERLLAHSILLKQRP